MNTKSTISTSAVFDEELLSKLKQLRNEIVHGIHQPDGKTVAQQLQNLGISVPPGDLQWFVAELLRGMSSHGEHFVPAALLDVVRGLLDGTKAELVIDPWAGCWRAGRGRQRGIPSYSRYRLRDFS